MLTYNDAANLMRRARNGRRKLENNTYLEEREDGFAVVLHYTDVVTIHPDGTYTVNSGGWHTVTTKDRITRYSPLRLFQKRYEWFVQVGGWDNGYTVEFFDGMTVDSNGKPVEAPASLFG